MASFRDLEGFLKEIDNKVFSVRSIEKLGLKASDIIYKRVKSGFGVDNDRKQGTAKRQKLKPLNPDYVKQRRKKGVKGEFGRPGKSNLTNTGQMLSSFVVKAKRGEFELTIPNSSRSDGKTNREIAQFVRRDRPFFAITFAERRILEKEVSDAIRASARKFGFL